MVEPGRQPGLVDEPAQIVLIGGGHRACSPVLRGQHLDGAQPAPGVGQKDAPEPALPQLLEQ